MTTTSSGFRRSIAVVIGINEYADGIPTLRTATNDARKLAALLTDTYRYDVTLVLDGDATRERIMSLLTTELPASVGDDDRVLFYFAGHGLARDGQEGPNGYLLPSDASVSDATTYLHMPDVHAALMQLRCRHMLVLLDACFAGAFLWSGTRDLGPAPVQLTQEAYDHFIRSPAWQVITSAAQDEKALDELPTGRLGRRDGVGEHSPFASALFDAIDLGKADVATDGKKDNVVTATELYLYLGVKLQDVSRMAGTAQTPRLAPLAKHRSGEFVFVLPDVTLQLPPAPAPTTANNPWVGLQAYDAGNADVFFGREAEIAELRAHVVRDPLTVVVGASGTGKSSLVKAGVLPMLAAEHWRVLPVVRPGPSPLLSLARALTPEGGETVDATPEAVSARMRAIVAEQQGAAPVLLVIDQFEELITLTQSVSERTGMLELLATLVAAHPTALRLVVTVRTDFEPNFHRTAFGTQWTSSRYVIPAMNRAALRDVIEKPAAARVLYFEPPELVETLLNEVVATPGALPLLSFALSEMYIAWVRRRANDRAIRKDDYDNLGGIAGALKSRADEEYALLPAEGQATMRRLMLRLVNTEEVGFARRRVSEKELTFPDARETERMQRIRQQLIDARLLVGGSEPGSGPYVEAAHDALIRGWVTLLDWVREEGAAPFTLTMQRQLTWAAEEWELAPENTRSALVWRGARSVQLLPVVKDGAPWLNVSELAFAERSIRSRVVSLIVAGVAALTLVIAGVALALTGRQSIRRGEAARVTAIAATAQGLVSDEPTLAGYVLATIDSGLVSRLDMPMQDALLGTAIRLAGVPRVVEMLGDGAPLEYAVASKDGTWLLASTGTHKPVVYNTSGSGIVRRFTRTGERPIEAAAISPDNALAAAAFDDGFVEVLPLDDANARPYTLRCSGSMIDSLHFSADHRHLIVHERARQSVLFIDGGPALTPLRTRNCSIALDAAIAGAERALSSADSTASTGFDFELMSDAPHLVPPGVTFGPFTRDDAQRSFTPFPARDSVTLTVLGPNTLRATAGAQGRLWIVDSSGRPTAGGALRETGAPVKSLAWSPDGTHLASIIADEGVLLWNTVTGRVNRRFSGVADGSVAPVFSRDGTQFLVTDPNTYRAIQFDTTGRAVPLTGHTNEILALRILPNGRVVTASRDGGVWIWAMPSTFLQQPVARTAPAYFRGNQASAVAFAADSRRVAVASRAGIVSSFTLADVSTPRTVDSSAALLRSLVWSNDGTRLHGLAHDGGRVTYGIDSSRAPVRIPGRQEDFLVDPQVAADGRHVAAFTQNGAFGVWDMAAAASPVMVELSSYTIRACSERDSAGELRITRVCGTQYQKDAALSADGRWVAACRVGALMVDPIGQIPANVTRARGCSSRKAVALSADGALVVASDTAGNLRVWKSQLAADTGRILLRAGIDVTRAAFSPDAARIAVASRDGSIRVFSADTAKPPLILSIRGDSTRVLRFTPDGARLLSGVAGEAEARLWRIDGKGTFVSLPANGTIRDAVMSPDGRWVAITSDRPGAQLYPIDLNLALDRFRTSKRCLPIEERERYLGEDRDKAAKAYDDCQTAVNTARTSRPR